MNTHPFSPSSTSPLNPSQSSKRTPPTRVGIPVEAVIDSMGLAEPISNLSILYSLLEEFRSALQTPNSLFDCVLAHFSRLFPTLKLLKELVSFPSSFSSALPFLLPRGFLPVFLSAILSTSSSIYTIVAKHVYDLISKMQERGDFVSPRRSSKIISLIDN